MMQVFRGVTLALMSLAVFVPGAFAKERLLKCELRQNGPYRGTPPEVVVVYEAGESRMAVFDSYLKHYERDPVLGKVSRDDSKMFVIRWKVKNMKTVSGQSMDWRFSLMWNKTNDRARITGKAAVSDDDNNGSGKCKFLK